MTCKRNRRTKGKEMRSLKAEYKTGGKNRQYVLDKAVKFLTAKIPISQGDRHHFLLEKIGLTETEYLECLNRATNGEVVRQALQ